MKAWKKASLSLSINAVVILVLAIAMLGLGLGFTKRMFAKFGDTLSIPEPDLTATEADPIVLISDTIEIPATDVVSLPIKFYSLGTPAKPVWPLITCTGTATQSIIGAPQTMTPGIQKVFRILVASDTVLSYGAPEADAQRICTISFCDVDPPQGPPPYPPACPLDQGSDTTIATKQISIALKG